LRLHLGRRGTPGQDHAALLDDPPGLGATLADRQLDQRPRRALADLPPRLRDVGDEAVPRAVGAERVADLLAGRVRVGHRRAIKLPPAILDVLGSEAPTPAHADAVLVGHPLAARRTPRTVRGARADHVERAEARHGGAVVHDRV